MHAVTLAPKTRKNYATLYDHHIAPQLGSMPLRELRAETVARWQADRLPPAPRRAATPPGAPRAETVARGRAARRAAGGAAVAVRRALALLGSTPQPGA